MSPACEQSYFFLGKSLIPDYNTLAYRKGNRIDEIAPPIQDSLQSLGFDAANVHCLIIF